MFNPPNNPTDVLSNLGPFTTDGNNCEIKFNIARFIGLNKLKGM